MSYCCVPGCTSYQRKECDKELSFHRFPICIFFNKTARGILHPSSAHFSTSAILNRGSSSRLVVQVIVVYLYFPPEPRFRFQNGGCVKSAYWFYLDVYRKLSLGHKHAHAQYRLFMLLPLKPSILEVLAPFVSTALLQLLHIGLLVSFDFPCSFSSYPKYFQIALLLCSLSTKAGCGGAAIAIFIFTSLLLFNQSEWDETRDRHCGHVWCLSTRLWREVLGQLG